jgi:predicted DNA-binding protein
MTITTMNEKSTVRFTVDLPLSLHQALTDLAQQQGKRKAVLVRLAISQLSVKDAIGEEVPLEEETRRFTLDMEPGEHQKFSILAIRMRRKKAELVRWAIGRLVDSQE